MKPKLLIVYLSANNSTWVESLTLMVVNLKNTLMKTKL